MRLSNKKEKLRYGDERLGEAYELVRGETFTDLSDFQKMVQQFNLRQNFLKTIHLEDATPYIDKLKYAPVNMSMDGNPMMMFLHPGYRFRIPILFPKKRPKTLVYVLPLSFELFQLGEFCSSLIDHEGFHAKDFHENPEFFENSEYNKTLIEVRAYKNQLNSIYSKKRGSGASLISSYQNRLKDLVLNLSLSSPENVKKLEEINFKVNPN